MSAIPSLRLIQGGGNDAPPDEPNGNSNDDQQLAEDLAYAVELWNASRTGIERVLAITTSASIGQGAFYAATRDYPDRYITLRHKKQVLNHWRGKSH